MADDALDSLIARIREAADHGRALAIRGGGTKAFYGNPSEGEELSTRDWRGIVSYEPSELVVTVRAGTPLAELESALAGSGQCLPFEPPHFGPGATVGGMVASGLSGPSRASVGAVREYVLGLQLVNGRGELLTFGGQVMKNVAGYDVSRLMVGALGTLGLITEVSLKVLPVAPAEATLRFGMGQAEALRKLNEWGGQPLPLNASCWMAGSSWSADTELPESSSPADPELLGSDPNFPRGLSHSEASRGKLGSDPNSGSPASKREMPEALGPRLRGDDGQRGILYLRLRGAIAAVDSACRALGGERLSQDESTPLWHSLREHQHPWFQNSQALDLWRLSVPQTAPVLDLPDHPLIEWHGAQRWLRTPPGTGSPVREAAAKAGGHATLFRAADPATRGRFTAAMPPLDHIQRELKRQFDPADIFNRGRLFTEAA